MKNTEKYILPETVFMNIFTHLTKLNTYSVPSIVLVIGRSLLHNATKIANKSFSSVQFSCSVIFDSLRPHGLQHARLRCLSPTPGAYSNSCPLSW